MTEVDVKALAKQAGLEVGAEELADLEREIPAILDFVKIVHDVPVDASQVLPEPGISGGSPIEDEQREGRILR